MTIADDTADEAPPPARIDLVDVARGLALAAMFVFHFTWDLSFFRLVDPDLVAAPGWKWFAHIIAGTFLAIVGVSLVLAARGGLDARRYGRRLATVAGAAALVSLATWLATPDSFIFFGILHHIAVAGLLALPFLAAPTLVLAVAAALAFALPLLMDHPVFDARWLTFLGLGQAPIRSNDFVPVFPWFGCVLAGMTLARLALASGARGWMGWRARGRTLGLAAWAGRHSLPIYLVHQPVFIAVLLVVSRFVGAPSADAGPFMRSCQAACVAAGQFEEDCRRACACTVAGLRRESLWAGTLADRLTQAERERVGAIAQACYRQD